MPSRSLSALALRCRAHDAVGTGGGFDFRDEFAREVGAESFPRGFGENIYRAGLESLEGVLAELTNMFAGNLKSMLCDRSYNCTLSIPSVVRGDKISISGCSTASA